jgi:hypothetical protein
MPAVHQQYPFNIRGLTARGGEGEKQYEDPKTPREGQNKISLESLKIFHEKHPCLSPRPSRAGERLANRRADSPAQNFYETASPESHYSLSAKNLDYF